MRLPNPWLTFLLWGTALPVIAQTQTVVIDEARLVNVVLYQGHGVTLNFREIGETIQRAWLDDLSKVTVDFDDPNCAVIGESARCAASIVHLRRIHPIEFPNLPATATTTLTVLTNEDLYTFRLSFPDSGTPAYSVLTLQERGPVSLPTRTLDAAEQIEQGLLIAQRRRLISTDEPLWERIQTCLQLIAEGLSPAEAAEKSGISIELLNRLSELGTGG